MPMTAGMKARVKQVFQECHLDWWIRAGGGDDRFFEHIDRVFRNVKAEYERRHGVGYNPLSIFTNGTPVEWTTRAFLQAVSASDDPVMLVMVLRILQGMNIEKLEMKYESERRFRLSVTLKSPYDDVEREPYVSEDIDSAAIVRHFGIMKMSDRPVFAGFYPLKLD